MGNKNRKNSSNNFLDPRHLSGYYFIRMLLEVSVLSPQKVLFEGRVGRVIVPGEQGVFEVLPFHKELLSRLLYGNLFIDEQKIPIKRGIISVHKNRIVILAEEQ